MMHRPANRPAEKAPSRDALVLSKAVVRAGEILGLSNRVLARVVGISEASASRLKGGGFVLEPGTKPFELGQLFVRLFRSLDAVAGSDNETSRSWMRAENLALRGKPVDLIQTVAGLANAVLYVDSRRARL